MEAVSYQSAVVLGFIPLNGNDEFRLRWGYLHPSFQVLLINSLNLILGVAVANGKGKSSCYCLSNVYSRRRRNA